jgi:hypothetical protein
MRNDKKFQCFFSDLLGIVPCIDGEDLTERFPYSVPEEQVLSGKQHWLILNAS